MDSFAGKLAVVTAPTGEFASDDLLDVIFAMSRIGSVTVERQWR